MLLLRQRRRVLPGVYDSPVGGRAARQATLFEAGGGGGEEDGGEVQGGGGGGVGNGDLDAEAVGGARGFGGGAEALRWVVVVMGVRKWGLGSGSDVMGRVFRLHGSTMPPSYAVWQMAGAGVHVEAIG